MNPNDAGDREDDLSHHAHSALNITTRCNQSCVFCFEGAHKVGDDLSREEVDELLRAARARAEHMIFMGGEALLRPDILDIVRYGCSIGLTVAAFTNGQVLYRAGFVEALAEAGLRRLMVSFHYADAPSFARGTRTRERNFGRLLTGLEHVRDYNRAHPDAVIETGVETELLVFNDGKLARIRELLAEHLGESFHFLSIGALVSSNRHRPSDDYLLVPFARRREELRALVASHPPSIGLSFQKLPLCLVPGGEHHSMDVVYRHLGVDVACNFYDPGAFEDIFQYDDFFANNPYRWVCRDCALLAICPTHRCSWDDPALHPTREQRPFPTRELTPAAVLARIVPEERIPHDALAEKARRLRALAMPERRLLVAMGQALAGDAEDGPTLLAAFAERSPVLDVVVRAGGEEIQLHLAPFARDLADAGYLLGPLCAVPVGEVGAARREALRPVLRALAAAPLPSAFEWADAGRSAMASPASAAAAWAAYGEALWPGGRPFGDGTVSRARAAADGAVALDLLGDDGVPTELWMRARGLASDGAAEGEVALVETDTLVVTRAHGEGDAAPPPAVRPPQPPAQTLETRAHTLRVVLVDRRGRLPEAVFFVGAVNDGEPAFRRHGGAGLLHWPYPRNQAFGRFVQVLDGVMRRVPEPPGPDSEQRWAAAIHAAFFRSGLLRRFTCTLTPVAAPGTPRGPERS